MKAVVYILILLSTPLIAQHDPISVREFKNMELSVVGVTTSMDTAKVVSYDNNDKLVIHHVKLGRGESLNVWTTSFFSLFAIVKVPLKIRPPLNDVPQNVFPGSSNVGLNLGVFNRKLDRYFINNRSSSHLFSAGVLFGPTAELLTPENTNNAVLEDIRQLFLSTGVTITYSYKDIAFTAVPLGFDFATTGMGKQFVYNGRMWWGFGIGIRTTLLTHL